jgi:hypothetical protein
MVETMHGQTLAASEKVPAKEHHSTLMSINSLVSGVDEES